MEAALRTASLPTAVTERHYTQQGRVFSSNVSGPPCQWIWTGGNDHWVRACDAMGGGAGPRARACVSKAGRFGLLIGRGENCAGGLDSSVSHVP